MYEKTPSPIPSAACLNRFVFVTLGLLTLAWIVYTAIMPPDPSVMLFGPLLRRLVTLGIAAAWIFSLAMSGLFWVIAQWTGRRE